MELDLQESAPGDAVACDVCVVGTGAAGLAVATELAATKLRVVVLEGGGLGHEAASQALYDCRVSGLGYAGHAEGRFRVFGGTTTRWGGQACPLTPLDFEPRDWVAHSGWPLRPDDLAPFQSRAARFLRVDDRGYGSDLVRILGSVRPPLLSAADLDYHFTKWAPEPDLRVVHGPALRRAANVTFVTHANVTRIDLTDDHAAVRQVTARSLAGRSVVVRPRAVVLCVGGIETARVLLANRHQRPGGLGNDNDLVGRFFQDHPAATVGTIESDRPALVQRYFNLYHRRGLKYAVRLSATAGHQRRNRTLNISSAVLFVTGARSGYAALRDAYHAVRRRAFGPPLVRSLSRSALAVPTVAQVGYHRYVRRRTYAPGARFSLNVVSEQEPSRDSRVTLADELDPLGVPRADVRWLPTPLTGRTIRTFAKTLRDEFARAGVGRLATPPWIDDEAADWREHITEQYHHIGTARMSRSAAGGVVDPDCRVHAIDNLYVGGSAVFPTGGHSNPTLTLIGLAMRIADRLKLEL